MTPPKEKCRICELPKAMCACPEWGDVTTAAPEASPCRKGGKVWTNRLFKFGKPKCVQCGAAEMRQFRKPA